MYTVCSGRSVGIVRVNTVTVNIISGPFCLIYHILNVLSFLSCVWNYNTYSTNSNPNIEKVKSLREVSNFAEGRNAINYFPFAKLVTLLCFL